MRTIEDQAILLLYAFTALLSEGPDTIFLTGSLCTVIYITLDIFPWGRTFRRIFCILFLAVLFFCPRLFCFLPVFLYDLLSDKNLSAAVLLLPCLCLYHGYEGDILPLLAQLPGCAAAVLLNHRTSTVYSLEKEYHQTRDNGRELNLLLKEKNQILLQDQDNEIYTVTLKERNRIARDIHDHVGHILSCSILMTGAVRTINTDPAVGRSLEQLEDTLHTAMDNIRQSVHGLHDESIDLKDTMERLAAAHNSCAVYLEYDMGRYIPAQVKYCLIAIVKEALHNIAKHSNASRARITLREHPGLYQLSIKDNGTRKTQAAPSGMGLRNMKDRTDRLGGTMQVYTDKGFQIFITIPKELLRTKKEKKIGRKPHEDHDRR